MNKCYLFLSLTLSVLACRKDNSLTNFKDDTAITNPYGSWKLLSKEDYSTNAVIYKDQEVYSYCSNRTPCDVILNFNRINTTDSITGHTITNEISGSFSYDGKLRTFKVGKFGATQVGDPKWSYIVLDNLSLVESFKINRSYLKLFFDGGKQSLTFERQ